MHQLNTQLKARITRGERAEHSLGNVDAHNPHFIGRTTELRRLRETVALGKVGVLTAVHGLGGVGKTVLSEELHESNCQFAMHLVFELRAIGCTTVPEESKLRAVEMFTPEELELLARIEHDRWVAERLITSWTFAEKKNIQHGNN